jgi:hypothetical protein
MQDYCDNERDQARNLKTYAEKWVNRLKQQSSLVSYHTTKRAQLDVVRVTKELARLKESTCVETQKVIEKYRAYINETYISERFRSGRKHRRANEFKKQFKTANTSVSEISAELETLSAQEKRARGAIRTADSACEILELDPTATEKQRARAADIQTKKRTLLEDLTVKIAETKEKYKGAQKTYRLKATEIFKQCQYVEEERLEQIRETLLDFIQAMHPPKYSSELDQIFEGLTTKITTQQNSFDDLLFWAKSYGIETKLTKSLPSTANDDDDDDNESVAESRPSKKPTHHETDKTKNTHHDKHQTVVENDEDGEELSAAINGTTPAKAKVKRTKSTIATDKKNTNTVEPSTIHNNTVLNQV